MFVVDRSRDEHYTVSNPRLVYFINFINMKRRREKEGKFALKTISFVASNFNKEKKNIER